MLNHVEIARSYIDTPFKHQGRLPHVGLDCAGVVVCSLTEAGYAVKDAVGYGRIPAYGVFDKCVSDSFDKILASDIKTGDFLTFAFRDEPQHIAIYDEGMLIHAYAEVGKVIRGGFSGLWRARLRGCYRLKDK